MKQHVPLVKPYINPGYKEYLPSQLDSRITCGINVECLEKMVRQEMGPTQHWKPDAVAVSSCTSGLMLVFQHLHAERRYEGDTVVLPAFTFGATMLAALWAGWKVRLCDVHIEDGTMDLSTVYLESDVAAVVPVDVFGWPADYETIRRKVAGAHVDCAIIADSAQSYGSYCKGPAGSQANYHVFSMSPSKIFTSGEGGLITGKDLPCGPRGDHFRALRDYGKKPGSLDFTHMGLSARMSEFNAAVGRANMERRTELLDERTKLADRYDLLLEQAEIPGLEVMPHGSDDASGRYGNVNYYVLKFDPLFHCVKSICHRLKEHGVETKRYFDPTLEYLTLARKDPRVTITQCDNALALAESCVAIPMFNGLTSKQQEFVIQTLKKIAS